MLHWKLLMSFVWDLSTCMGTTVEAIRFYFCEWELSGAFEYKIIITTTTTITTDRFGFNDKKHSNLFQMYFLNRLTIRIETLFNNNVYNRNRLHLTIYTFSEWICVLHEEWTYWGSGMMSPFKNEILGILCMVCYFNWSIQSSLHFVSIM